MTQGRTQAAQVLREVAYDTREEATAELGHLVRGRGRGRRRIRVRVRGRGGVRVRGRVRVRELGHHHGRRLYG